MDRDHDFFILLNAGLGRKTTEKLSDNPDWDYIYTLACQQTVTGIVADGITSLTEFNQTRTVPIHERFLIDAARIAKTNLRMLDVQEKICSLLEQNNLTYVILKGQAVAQYYPNPLARFSGDIDILLPENDYNKAKSLLANIGTNPTDKPLAGEFAIYIDNVQVELHDNIYAGINSHCVSRFPELVRELFTNRIRSKTLPGHPYVPPTDFDAIYLLIHTARHLGSFGISLRQVLDWQMCITSLNPQPSTLNHLIEELHLTTLWTQFSNIENIWPLIKECGNFGCTSKYKTKHFNNKIYERIYRTHFLLQQANKIKTIDPEFANFLKHREIKSFFSSIIRSLNHQPSTLNP